jgi:hypothetical protein
MAAYVGLLAKMETQRTGMTMSVGRVGQEGGIVGSDRMKPLCAEEMWGRGGRGDAQTRPDRLAVVMDCRL